MNIRLAFLTYPALLSIWVVMTLTASAQTNSVTLIWDPNTDLDLAGYKMHYGPASGVYTNVIDLGNVTTNSVSNLLFGATYYFAVTAYNTSGLESGFSNEVNYTPGSNQVNAPPTLDPIGDVAINENAMPQTVLLTGITSGSTNEIQNLTVTAVSSNPALIPNPTVAYASPSPTGTLTFAPLLNTFGTAVLTVSVNDGGATNNLVTQSFNITVNSINQPPTLDPINNIVINENAGPQTVSLTGITSGSTNEIQTLTVAAVSSNPALIPNPTVTYASPNTTGALTFTPSTNTFGTAVMTVSVNDGGATNNLFSRSFTVTVNFVDTPPFISAIPDQTILKNQSTPSIPFTIGDAETPAQNLLLSASSSNKSLVQNSQITFGGSGSNRTVTVTPARKKTGTSVITISVSDGTLQASTAFLLTVAATVPAIASRASQPAAFRILSVTTSQPSSPSTLSPLPSTPSVSLEWASTAGATYRVMYKDDLNAPTWTDLSGPIMGLDGTTSWTDTTTAGSPSRFYCVMQVQ